MSGEDQEQVDYGEVSDGVSDQDMQSPQASEVRIPDDIGVSVLAAISSNQSLSLVQYADDCILLVQRQDQASPRSGRVPFRNPDEVPSNSLPYTAPFKCTLQQLQQPCFLGMPCPYNISCSMVPQ